MISWVAQFYLIVILYRKLQALTIFANWISIHSFNTCDNSLRQKQNFKTAQKHPQCLNNCLFPLQNLKTPMVASTPPMNLFWWTISLYHPFPGIIYTTSLDTWVYKLFLFLRRSSDQAKLHSILSFLHKKISILLLTEKPSQFLHFQNFKLDTQYLQFVNLRIFFCKEFTVLTKHQFLLPGRC